MKTLLFSLTNFLNYHRDEYIFFSQNIKKRCSKNPFKCFLWQIPHMSWYLIPQLYPKSREIALLYLQIDLIEQNNGPCEWVQAVQDRLLYSPAAEAFFVFIRPREKNLRTALKTTKFRKKDGGYDILPKPMFVLKRKAPEKLNLNLFSKVKLFWDPACH